MKASQTILHGSELERMIDQAKVLFDLRMAGVVPVSQARTVEVAEEFRKIAVDRKLFKALAVFNPKPDAA